MARNYFYSFNRIIAYWKYKRRYQFAVNGYMGYFARMLGTSFIYLPYRTIFLEKKSLAIILSVPLGLSSVITIFMALYGIFNSPSYRTESIAMLIIGTVLVLAALKMPFKYDVNKVHVES